MKYYIYSPCFEKESFQVTKKTFNEVVDAYSFHYTIWRLTTKYCKAIVMYVALINGEFIHQIGYTVEDSE